MTMNNSDRMSALEYRMAKLEGKVYEVTIRGVGLDAHIEQGASIDDALALITEKNYPWARMITIMPLTHDNRHRNESTTQGRDQ